MVGLGRLELPTSPLSGVRSNQLSYKPITCFCFLPYAAPLVRRLFSHILKYAPSRTPHSARLEQKSLQLIALI
jgi:hypothetical protein